jgi:hypothetical protein
LRRIGVQLTADQEAQVKGFMAVGNAASAQKVILGELERQIGGVAEAYGATTAGQMTIFQNKIGDIQEAIGAGLLPTINSILGQVMTLTGAVDGNTAAWTTVTAAITQFLALPLVSSLSMAAGMVTQLNTVVGELGKLLEMLGIKTATATGELNILALVLQKLGQYFSVFAGGPVAWAKAAIDALTRSIREANALIKSFNAGTLGANVRRDLGKLGIPGFASGGVVPGPIGAPMLAVVHGGETITPPGNVTNNDSKTTKVYINTLNLTGVQDAAGLLRQIEALGT